MEIKVKISQNFFCFLMLIFFSVSLKAQNMASKFRVSFTDKNNSPYSISSPSQFLSEKSLKRRAKMNIPIVFNDLPVNPWYVDSVRNSGATVLTVSKWFNCVSVYTTDANVLNKIRNLSFVSGIDTIGETSLKKGGKPQKKRDSMGGSKQYDVSEGSFGNSVDLADHQNLEPYNYGLAFNQVHMIRTDDLHAIGYRGEGMTIAVLDAGFFKVDSLPAFDSLRFNHQILGTRDFVNPGGNVYTRSTHGMAVLSIMGGNIPGVMLGTAPRASYWLLRSEDADSEYLIEEDNWVAAAEFADSAGVDIINSSLGYTVFFNPDMDHSYADMDGNTTRVTKGADLAASKGILVVNSAGNSGNGNWYYIGAPADADSIVTVGAVNSKGKLASFSSRGPSFDGRVKPTVCAMGEGTYVSSISGNASPGNGTSFSSPVIAGSLACLWQANYHLSNMQVIDGLIQSSSKFLNPDSDYGYGIPNFKVANLILQGLKINNLDYDNSCNVFPNPFTDEIKVIFYSRDTAAYSVNIFDVNGKMVYSKENITKNQGCNYIEIKGLSFLNQGFYLLKVVSESKVFSTKIFKGAM